MLSITLFRNRSLVLGLLFFFFATGLSSCLFSGDKEDSDTFYFDAEKQKEIDDKLIHTYWKDNDIDSTDIVRTESGLYYQRLIEGSGAAVEVGKKVSIHYKGYLLNNKQFDGSYDRNEPLEYTVGVQRLISGWEEGSQMMQQGEKARLYVPSHLGYGPYQTGPIPPNSVLIFELEVLSVK